MLNKKYLIIAIVVLSILIGGCGKKKQELPNTDSELLYTIIRNEIDNHFDNISDWNYQVKSVEKEGKTCEVEVDIDAVGKYAKFKIEGKLIFVLGESGWEYSIGTLEKKEYELTDYPDSKYLYRKMINYYGMDGDEEEKDFSVQKSEKNNETTISITFSEQIERCLYSYTRDCTRNFTYDPIFEEWFLDNQNDSWKKHSPKLRNIDGVYEAENNDLLGSPTVDVKIYDTTDNSFKIKYPNIDHDLEFHFTDKHSEDFCCDLGEKEYLTASFYERNAENNNYYEKTNSPSGDYKIIFKKHKIKNNIPTSSKDICIYFTIEP